MTMQLYNPALADGSAGTITIEQFPFVLGRSSAADFSLPLPFVSRQHCKLSRFGDGYIVEDLDTPNGTFVNGEQVHGPTPLNHGDILSFGPLAYRVYLHGFPQPSAGTAVAEGNEQSTQIYGGSR